MVDLSPRDQVKKRVPTLTKHAEEVRAIEPDQVNSFGPWSALKLIVLVATVNMYTTVISSYRDDWFYVDALAGSGVSVYGDVEDCFLGSPILAAAHASEQFTKMYFIEAEKKKARALEKRLDAVFEGETPLDIERPECGYEVITGDANNKLPDVTRDMWATGKRYGKKASFNHLTFIDNQGLNLRWEGIENIAPEPHGDFLVNFPARDIIRSANHEDSEESMTEFYGSEIWKDDKTREGLLQAYLRRLNGIEKPRQVITNVHSGITNYEYDVIYATKQEGGNYIDAVEYVRDFVERVDGADVEQMLDVLRGDQATMETYLPEIEGDEDEPQKRIGEF